MRVNTAYGLSMAILEILRKYKKPIPIEYLAKILGRRDVEINEKINALQKEGIIARDGNKVSVEKKHSSAS